MCEVVKSNFKELYPKIEKSLKKGAFIAIDSEFSGLVSHSKLKNSLFDTSADRYLKLKCSIEQFTIYQFGLAIFHYNRDDNKYTADVYSFYTFPCSFGPVDNRFLCQATSWEFLQAHNFNFNKVAYEGVPFLSEVQEQEIRKQLGAGTMFSNVERSLSYRDEDMLQAECSRVAQWLPLAAPGDTMDIIVSDTQYSLTYFLHKELRARFKDVWTFPHRDKVEVKKLSAEEIQKALESEGNQLDSALIHNLLGFTKVFKLLIALKKPIIGHNLLLDLMILYNQMYKPLPSTYEAFKKQINILFPSIHDTKFISYKVRDLLKKQDSWSSNKLDHLYTYFSTNKGLSLASYSPTIKINESESGHIENVETHVHEAAWDAYMSGYCFIRLAHFLAIRRLGEGALPRPMSRIEHLSAVADYCNCINVIRGSISHMNIGGKEPPSHRPRPLYISRLDRKPIDIDKVTALMASYGSVDVKTHTVSSALIAVSNRQCARDIVKAYVADKEYRVVPYSYLRHSSLISTLSWSGLILSGTVCAAVLISSAVVRK
uniref:Uncharacterized protein n=1 Tax=Cuerna arida TaxID=1464854 RepID=A0A1B6F437_9HEMI